MWLRFGWDERWDDAFATEAEYAEAWARNRDRLLAACPHGRRPMAWWRFEAPIQFPGYDHEPAVLFEADLLAEAEIAALLAEWREQFEKAQAPDFWFCLGPGCFLKGVAAKKAHLQWAGVPRTLVRKWTAQRRRRGKTVRAPATASVPAGTQKRKAPRVLRGAKANRKHGTASITRPATARKGGSTCRPSHSPMTSSPPSSMPRGRSRLAALGDLLQYLLKHLGRIVLTPPSPERKLNAAKGKRSTFMPPDTASSSSGESSSGDKWRTSLFAVIVFLL
jgi:hypothetical protein